MKLTLLLTASLLCASTSFAKSSCQENIEAFMAKKAPNSKEILVSGSYTQKSKDGTYKKCALSIKTDGTELTPYFSAQSFNPQYGDGGAFWPLGTYTMEQPVTDQYRTILGYSCKADAEGFSTDLYYKNSGWPDKKRFILSVLPNATGTFDVTLVDGDPRANPVTCRGLLSEK